uniref:Uncharacterized protein n=1 Tax=Oncorhynchus mykiss TaxID=8022 RepID=A0A8K9XZP3_ONCMY
MNATVEHTASEILFVQKQYYYEKIKNKTLYYSLLEFWLFTKHTDFCGCSFFWVRYLFFLLLEHVNETKMDKPIL